MRRGFIERSVSNLLRASEQSLIAERAARAPGLLQSLDARAKLAGFLSLIAAVTVVRNFTVIGCVFALTLALALVSRISAWPLFGRVWLAAFFFTGVIVTPALFITPGRIVADWPFGLTVSDAGLRTAGYLIGRVETTASLSLLLVLSTRWAGLLRALRAFRVPLVMVAVLGMTYRYIFVLLQASADLFEGRRSRRIGPLAAADERRLATSSAGALLTRSIQMSEDIYLAMQARGFRGEVYVLERSAMKTADWLALGAFAAAAVVAAVVGR